MRLVRWYVRASWSFCKTPPTKSGNQSAVRDRIIYLIPFSSLLTPRRRLRSRGGGTTPLHHVGPTPSPSSPAVMHGSRLLMVAAVAGSRRKFVARRRITDVGGRRRPHRHTLQAVGGREARGDLEAVLPPYGGTKQRCP
jgi:hypothetical protein